MTNPHPLQLMNKFISFVTLSLKGTGKISLANDSELKKSGRGFIIFALCLIFAFPAFAQDETQKPQESETPAPLTKTFGASEFTLENGMHVVVIPNHRAPVVQHMVWYKAGAADEKPGTSGIAHFMEHLMFKGSGNEELGIIGPGEFSKTVKSLGGNDNAFTSQDYTAYFQSIAVEHLPTVMRMEAGRMAAFNPSPDQVASENEVILEERRQRTDNDPEARFHESINAALYVNHPYGIPVIGWKHEMPLLSRADALDWHEHYYAPNNATLIIAGDVTPEQVYDLAQETYAKIPRRQTVPRAYPAVPELSGHIKITAKDPQVKQPSYRRLYLAPSARENKNDALALQVLQEIMSSGSTSRLYKSLVVDQKIASAAQLYYSPDSWGTGDIWLYAIPLPGHDLEDIEEALLIEIQKIINQGVSDDEVNEAIARLQNEAIYARDSLTGPAMIVGRSLMTGSSLKDIEYWPHDIATIKAADIRRVADQYLNENARTVSGFLYPGGEE